MSEPSVPEPPAVTLLEWLDARVDDPLDGVQVERGERRLLVRLAEGASVPIAERGPDEPPVLVPEHILRALSVPTWGNGDVQSLAVFADEEGLSGDRTPVLRQFVNAGACGFASFDLDGIRVHWETRPKIRGTDWLSLVALAEGWQRLGMGGQADYDAADGSLAELLVRGYLHAVERLLGLEVAAEAQSLAGRGLRRAYDPRHDVLRGRLRGQLDRAGYLQQVARGRPDRVPCRFHLHDLDNLPNRALRWALHLCLSLLPSIADAARRTRLEARLRVADARFAGVSWRRVTRADLPALRRPPRSLKAYQTSGALPLAVFLLEQAQLGSARGDFSSVALAFDMPNLFEYAFAQGFPADYGVKQAQANWRLLFESQTLAWGSGANDLKPDLYLPGSGAQPALVVDTKWKDADTRTTQQQEVEPAEHLPIDDLELDGTSVRLSLRVRRGDLHQILAYALAARAQPGQANVRVRAALVYPTMRKRDLWAELRWPAGGESHPWLSVVVVGWPVGGSNLQEALADIAGNLLDAATADRVSAA